MNPFVKCQSKGSPDARPSAEELMLLDACGITDDGVRSALRVYRLLKPVFDEFSFLNDAWGLSEVVARVSRQLASDADLALRRKGR